MPLPRAEDAISVIYIIKEPDLRHIFGDLKQAEAVANGDPLDM